MNHQTLNAAPYGRNDLGPAWNRDWRGKLQLNRHRPQTSIVDIQPPVAWMRYIIIINTLRPEENGFCVADISNAFRLE